MAILLASVPILLILVLMVGLRWGAARAGAAGYLTALLIAIFYFGAGPQLLAVAHSKALLLALDVLLIIWAAFLLYRVADEAGAIRVIGDALPHLTADRGMQALIIGWAFASFLQGVGGFGVPVAVVAPILVGLGFAPLAAVLIPSIGHGWSVTFGSLGSSFQALVSATNQPEEILAPPAAFFLGVACVLVGLEVAHAAGGWSALRRLLGAVLIIGTSMAVVQWLAVRSGAWPIAAFLGGLAGLLVCIPLARRHRGEAGNNGQLDRRALLIAMSGYIILVVLTLILQVIPAVKEALGGVYIQIDFPQTSTQLGYVTAAGASRKIPVFRHAGAVLLYTCLASYLVYRWAGLYKSDAPRRILHGTVQRVMSSSVSIISMVAMAVIMEYAGMTDILARGLAEGMGRLFPWISPWIGALGAFMTGSNTNSNVVFGGLQMQTALLLGFPVAIILAAQTAGAGLASIMAPTKVVVGASTAGMAGHEGEVMRKLIVYTGLMVLLIGLLAAISVRLF